jgi:hypothetical protein
MSATVYSTELARYTETGFQEVEGWLGQGEVQLTESFDRFQKKLDIAGDVCEIGVHHGRYFILLYLLRRPTERAFAIDLFENQELNIDGSGAGSLAELTKNIEIHCSDRRSYVPLKLDSLSVSANDFDRHTSNGRFRLFSIDGGHTPVHTSHDLGLAETTLAPGGIVMLDDVFNREWPGVFEGWARYMLLNCATTLAPVVIGGNKVFLTTASYHQKYLDALETSGLQILRRTKVFSWPVLIM